VFCRIFRLNRREKRTLKMVFRFKCVVQPKAWCLASSCRNAAILQIQLKIQKILSIDNFPCHIRSSGVLRILTFSLVFVEIVKIGEYIGRSFI
jgi:hypothetical protein